MDSLANDAAVVLRLGRALTTAESGRTAGLLQEATAIVLAYMKKPETYYDAANTTPIPVPATVAIVTSRAVARVLEQAANGGSAVGADSVGQQAGPFGTQVTYTKGATSGGPWLTRADKTELDNVTGANRAYSVDTAPGSYAVHDVACALNFGALYCSCGFDIAGYVIFGAGD